MVLEEKTNKSSLNEVLESKYRKKNDHFFVKYQEKTFEISNFLIHHPGGQVLRNYRGFALDKVLADVPHSTAAMHLFHEFRIDNQRAYDDIEKLIDWNAPLLFQVNSLGPRYWEWVNLPVNRSIRLFRSDFLELLTVTPWYLVPIIWIPISIFFLYHGIKKNLYYSSDTWIYSSFNGFTVVSVILAFFWGFILWTLLEYTLHRKLFHLRPSPDSKVLITLHFLFHGLHHKAPFDSKRLVFPPLASIVLAGIFYYLYKILFHPLMLDATAAGTMIGYMLYDLMHYYLHHGAPSADTYLYTMKRYHNYHHFTHHEHGFGISSKFWDYIFGTLIVLRQLKKAIIW